MAAISGFETINAPWVVVGFCLVITVAVWHVKADIFYYTDKIKIGDMQHFCPMIWITVFLFLASTWQMTDYYKEKYEESKDISKSMEEILQTIPEEATVSASNTLTAHLADHLELYTAFSQDTEYLVLDLWEGQGVVLEDARKQALQRGYQEIYYRENTAIIFRKE